MELIEQLIWEAMGECLCHIYNLSDPDAMKDERTSYINKLEKTLQSEVQDAAEFLASVDKTSRSFDADEFETQAHAYRRRVAGYHQILDLLKQGKHAYAAAMKDQVVIFRGHRQVSCLFIVHPRLMYNFF